MCIRDSFRSAPNLHLAELAAAIGMVASQVGVDEYVIDAPPVSYTHLRAHETVLDLVCRLLLDTKNPA